MIQGKAARNGHWEDARSLHSSSSFRAGLPFYRPPKTGKSRKAVTKEVSWGEGRRLPLWQRLDSARKWGHHQRPRDSPPGSWEHRLMCWKGL